MINVINKIVENVSKSIARNIKLETKHDHDREFQILLAHNFRESVVKSGFVLKFADVEFSAYSQNGEDGILLYIFTLIGTTNKQTVEICAGDGIECNSANLIINHGWDALLFDGHLDAIQHGREFYTGHTNAWRLRRLPPVLIHAWVTRDNINNLITSHGFTGEIDLLSLDMDGVDYWIWHSIECISPRVVIVEFNNRWSSDQSVTVPYSDNFVGLGATVEGEGYFGASLLAFARLGVEKGYRLIGANSPSTNAFFMRNDVGNEIFPTVAVEDCLNSAYATCQHRTKYPLIKEYPVVQIKRPTIRNNMDIL